MSFTNQTNTGNSSNNSSKTNIISAMNTTSPNISRLKRSQTLGHNISHNKSDSSIEPQLENYPPKPKREPPSLPQNSSTQKTIAAEVLVLNKGRVAIPPPTATRDRSHTIGSVAPFATLRPATSSHSPSSSPSHANSYSLSNYNTYREKSSGKEKETKIVGLGTKISQIKSSDRTNSSGSVGSKGRVPSSSLPIVVTAIKNITAGDESEISFVSGEMILLKVCSIFSFSLFLFLFSCFLFHFVSYIYLLLQCNHSYQLMLGGIGSGFRTRSLGIWK